METGFRRAEGVIELNGPNPLQVECGNKISTIFQGIQDIINGSSIMINHTFPNEIANSQEQCFLLGTPAA